MSKQLLEEIREVKELVNKVRTDVNVAKEGVKRINGSIAELKAKDIQQDEKLYKHEGFIQTNKAKIALVAATVSTIVGGAISLAFALLR